MALPRISKAAGTAGKPSPSTKNYGVVGGIALTFPLSDIVGQELGRKSPVKRRFVIDYNSHASCSPMSGGPRRLGSLPRHRRYRSGRSGVSVALPTLKAGGGNSTRKATQSSPSFVEGSPPAPRSDEYRVSMVKRDDDPLPHSTDSGVLQRPQSRMAAMAAPDLDEQPMEFGQVEAPTGIFVDMNFRKMDLENIEADGAVIDRPVDEPVVSVRHFSPPTARAPATAGRRPRTASAPEYTSGSSPHVTVRYVS